MITERTLKNWRRDAFSINKKTEVLAKQNPESLSITTVYIEELNNRILRLTQDLLDYRLMEGRKS
jgi:hypothetical protein